MSSSINGIGIFTPSYSRALTEMRRNFDDLNLQLATGKRSETYGGLGSDRGMALTLRGKLSDMSAFSANIQQVSVRAGLMLTSLSGLSDIATQTRGDLDPNNYLLVDGSSTIAQQSAGSRFDTAVEALNADVAGLYLFGGREVGGRPVASSAEILDGTATRAGLRTVIQERKAANLGADNRGRLTAATAAGTTVSLAQTAATNAFGFKLGAIGATGSGALTVAGPTGTPPAVGITVASQPKSGDVVRLALNLPDGSTKEIALTASTNAPFSGDVARVAGAVLPAGTNANTALNDPGLGLAVGNVFTINGQDIEVVAAGAGAGEINVTDTLDDLLGQIEGLTGVGSATFDATTRQVRIVSTTGTDLTISGAMGARLGLNGTHQNEVLQRYDYQIAYDGLGNFDAAATARNLAGTLDQAIQKEAKTSLVAASAVQAAKDFFADPPLRVDGTPATATALRDGSTDTVDWYRGESGLGSPRKTQVARIDGAITADYGARANEEGIRELLTSVGTLAATALDTGVEEIGKSQYRELTTRLRPMLMGTSGLGPVEGLLTEITNVVASVDGAKERHKMSKAVADTMLSNIENVNKEEVAANLLSLQTSLQMSYQATAMVSQLSLANFL